MQTMSKSTLALVAATIALTLTPMLARAAQGQNGTAPRLYGKIHALCIGINEYDAATLSPLSWAEEDAARVAEVLEQTYGCQTSPPLLGLNATRDRIFESIDEVGKKLRREDALIIYYSGHGDFLEKEDYGRIGYLIASDSLAEKTGDASDIKAWDQDAINMRQLGERLQKFPCRHVLLLVDACYSGFLGKRSAGSIRPDIKELVRRPSRMIITAGTEDQEALESEEFEAGMFTHALLQSLDSSEPQTATEVFARVRKEVARLSGRSMLPQCREMVIGNGEFVFLPTSVRDEAVPEALVAINKRINRRSARNTTEADFVRAYNAMNYRYSSKPAREARDWKGRFKRFEENAALGQPFAMAGLYYCWRKGLGVERDDDQAFAWAQRAYDSEHPVGMHVLGACYREGIGVGVNKRAADELLDRACEAGSAVSIFFRGNLRLRQAIEAKTLTSEKAKAIIRDTEVGMGVGIWRAYSMMGSLITGDTPVSGFATDLRKGMDVLEEGSNLGSPECQTLLSIIHRAPKEVVGGDVQDVRKAEDYVRKAAAAGYGPAQIDLAAVLATGKAPESPIPVDKDVRRAIEWFELAAQQEYAKAHIRLAYLYSEGQDIAKDFEKARHHCDEAIRLNSPAGLTLQGKWYLFGNLFPKDEEKAVSLFRQAADQGDPDGCMMLGACFEDVIGVHTGRHSRVEMQPYYMHEALHWYVQAASKGQAYAKERLEKWWKSEYRAQKNLAKVGIPWDDGSAPTPARIFSELTKKYPESAEKLQELMGDK